MMSSSTRTNWIAAMFTIATLWTAGTLQAQGVTTRSGAVVLYGSVCNCSQPSTVNYKTVQRATPEWKKIRADGVEKGSARYDLLTAQMSKRIKKAVSAAAQANSRDCVVRKGDIQDAEGLKVTDLTQAVVDELSS